MRPDRSCRTAFVLQGGGALGAYQAGAACALEASGVRPDIVAGISIGAINAALIAGNPPERRVERLATFWRRVTSASALPGMEAFGPQVALAAGAPGFFTPRIPPAALMPPSDPARVGFYDTDPLRATLAELVDFDLLNDGPVWLVVGAVNVGTGNFVWFDSAERRIGPEHIMASGALPPGFPPVEIDGAWFWDGGLMSNTPLARVVETRADHQPLVIWQVDLFSARGPVPHSVWTVEAREKDIRYSSRTRAITDRTRQMHDLACALHAHADALPEALKAHPAVAPLLDSPARGPLTLIHLIYRAKPYETGAKDYDFSRFAMTRHWRAGEADVARCLAHPLLAEHDPTARGMHVFDLADGQHLKETPHDGR
ncbi:MAG: patatin-like phospholipase family protein [Alphaproteobacteria bacterium]|nr:MAG: patatin-like phospholipase family protein [Alphaproteobacteria bacterium]